MLEHPYQPLLPGTTWHYATGQANDVHGPQPRAASTERVVSAHREGALLVAEIEEQYAYAPQALSRRRVVVGSAGVLPEIHMDTPAGEVRTLSSNGVSLPRHPEAGAHFSYAVQFTGPLQTADIFATLTVIGFEQVEVPAGTFRSVHISCDLRNHLTTKTKLCCNTPPQAGGIATGGEVLQQQDFHDIRVISAGF